MMTKPASRSRQRGVALAIVVWFIAGMSLLVSGIVAEARVDTRMAQLHYFRAQAAAAGDGAINLALAEQIGLKASGSRGADRQQAYRVGNHDVEVRMIPAGLLVNISTEKAAGLRSLFSQTDASYQLSPNRLASAVVRYREGAERKPGQQFHSLEDLLRVPGVDRGVYDAVRDFIVVESLASGLSGKAPAPARIRMIDAAMRGEGALLNGPVQHAAESVRVDAIVKIGDQNWIRRRWVTFEGGGYSALPWRVVRSEAARPLMFEDRG